MNIFEQVIGGLQRFAAINIINDRGERVIQTRKCVVYGNALSASSVLLLARQHNDYNQIQRVSSFPEVAACCRRLLFSHFGTNVMDDENVSLEVPRYNSQPYRDYKKECVPFITNSQIVSSLRSLSRHLFRGCGPCPDTSLEVIGVDFPSL